MKEKNFISDFSNSKKNNFDFLRFIAAIFVIFSHAYPLSYGNNDLEPIYRLTDGRSTLGFISVGVFFVISGFLITQSFERTNNFFKYFLARILRIFPGLAFALLVTSFILGPIFSSNTVLEYFTNIRTYTYLTNITLLDFSPSLPGLFEINSYGNIVNGSLWTLKYEFLAYIIVALMGIMKLLRKKVVIVLFLISFILSYFPLTGSNIINEIPNLFRFFAAGMLLYLYRESVPLKPSYAFVSILLLIFSTYIGLFVEAFIIFGSYLTIYLSYNTKVKIYNFSKYGDVSYGLYIFAFPIQQIVTQMNGGTMNHLVNFTTSAIITLILAFLSWHFVEKNFMKLKGYYSINKKINRTERKAS